MLATIVALSVLLALAVGGLVYASVLGARWRALASQHETALARAQAQVQGQEQLLAALKREHADTERAFKEYVAARDGELEQRFKALASDCLEGANKALLQLAHERFKAQQQLGKAELDQRQEAVTRLVQPIADSLKRTDEKLGLLQKEWTSDRSSLNEQIKSLGSAGAELRAETSKLSRALSKPEVRGRYGEIQLKRVAELAGMVSYCDFAEQDQRLSDDGRVLRPDMVVRLPNERMIAVDAKCPIFAYVEAIESDNDAKREECFERFAGHVEKQVMLLAGKRYWAEFKGSPEFVVMFVPGDQFLDAALSRRSDLLDRAAQNQVILASPATLIGLLRAVHVGWRERQIEAQAQELFDLGKQLLDRTSIALGHLVGVGNALQQASSRYNAFVSSYESRLQPVLGKFKDAGVQGKELPRLEHVDLAIRTLQPLPPPRAELDAPQERALIASERNELDAAPSEEVS